MSQIDSGTELSSSLYCFSTVLQWLEKNTFPEESRYANEEHARDMASKFVTAVAASGTTLALVYCSVHPSSAAALFDAATQKGIRVIAGPVLMDSNCPSDLQLPCSEAIPALRGRCKYFPLHPFFSSSFHMLFFMIFRSFLSFIFLYPGVGMDSDKMVR